MQSALRSLLLDQGWCHKLLQLHVFSNNGSFKLPFPDLQYDQLDAAYILKVPLINPSYLITWSLLLLILLLLAYWSLAPTNIVRDWTEPSQDNTTRSRQIPPVFPNGWIPVAESLQVTSKAVHQCRLHIHELALVRDENGKVCALDAYCPHLGADLRVGGEIVREVDGSVCIRCPFHGWMFRGRDGLCVKVPYAKDEKPPPGLKAKKWDVMEANGFICIWFHADGEASSWSPPLIPEIQSGQWAYGGRTENLVNCHLQEIPENGADVGHLMAIHSPSAFWGQHFGPIARSKLASFLMGTHDWFAQWDGPADTDKHIAHLTIIQSLALLGINVMTLNLTVRQVGPCLVLLVFTCPEYNLKGAYCQAVMPQAKNRQKIVHHLYLPPFFGSRLLSRIMLFGEANMVDRDCIMWQNKKFLKNPSLVREEKPIARFRAWYSQFYSDNSPKSFESHLDW